MLSDMRATQRAIGDMLGVNHTTVGRDLDDGANAPKEETEVEVYKELENDLGANAPPIITKSGAEIVEIVEIVEKRACASQKIVAEREIPDILEFKNTCPECGHQWD